MRNWTTSAKLWFLGISAALGIIVVGLVGTFAMTGMSDRIDKSLMSAKADSQALVNIKNAQTSFLNQVQEWKNILIRGNAPEQFEKYLKAFKEKGQKTQDYLASAIATMESQQLPIANAQAVKSAHAMLDAKYLEALTSFDHSDPLAGKYVDKLVKGIDRATTDGMTKIVTEIEQQINERITAQVEAGHEENVRTRLIFIGLATLGVIVMSVIAFFIKQDLMDSLGGEPAYASAVVRSIAGGDLTTNINLSINDNNSLLAAMKQMQSALHKVITGIHGAADVLADASQTLASTSHQVAMGSQQQSQASASTAAAIEEMTASIQQVADSAKNAEALAESAKLSATQSGALVKNTISEINQIAGSVHTSTKIVYALGEHSDKISGIANVIKEIADQTNLLALNAAIEAARAGEQGRGFAVVADEVRKLAEKTTISTHEIASMIVSIQEGTKAAVVEMEQGTGKVEIGVKTACQTGDSMANIESSASQMLVTVEDIAMALREQSQASQQIAGNIEHIAQMTEENSAAVEEVSNSAKRLQSVANELKAHVSSFKL